MYRLAIACVLVLGCHGNSKSTTPGTGSGSGSDGVAHLVKKISISWGIQQQADQADLYLALTDETGSVQSHEIGVFKGKCGVIAPAKEMNALTGVGCTNGGTGTELHALTQGGDKIIVLRMTTDQGVAPDPMSREEVTRISIPLGIAVEVDPIAATTGAPAP